MDVLTPAVLADGINAFIYMIDYESCKLTYSNRMALEYFPELRTGSRCYELFFNSDVPCLECPLNVIRQNKSSVRFERFIKRIGRWMQIVYSDMELTDGTHSCVVTAVDVTPIHQSLNSMERLLDGIHAAAYTISPSDYRIKSANKELRNMLPDIKTESLCYQALWDRDCPCIYCPLTDHDKQDGCTNMNVHNPKLNRHLSIDMVKINGTDGDELAVFTAYDISRLIESENQLKHVAYTDVLTGARNRISFMDDLSAAFEKGSTCCLCVLNIKYLKRYNLLYGKKQGDHLLCKIAALYASRYDRNKVYRIDGAKFGFIAQGIEEISLLRKTMSETSHDFLTQWKDQNFHLFFDTVYVTFPEYSETPEQAIYQAEYLLGKNSKKYQSDVLEFNRREQALLNRRHQIEHLLRTQVYNGTFFVYYQPIYDIQSGTYSKCEALLRLFDETLGFIPPTEFIPIAEESGTIGDLSKFVLEQVCSLLKRRKSSACPDLIVNVNVSPMDFARSGFCEEVISIVRSYDVNPSKIQLEITESILIDSMDYILDTMNKLVDYGFSFAIDDFGTGYSALSYIGKMPLECLKLDKSFMDMMLNSDAYRLIITNVIEIAKGLHLSIVAEGIESEQQYDLIKLLGSNYIQGFLFSRPLPEEEFEAFLDKNYHTKHD